MRVRGAKVIVNPILLARSILLPFPKPNNPFKKLP